jgi:opacity protein-like surface antigen
MRQSMRTAVVVLAVALAVPMAAHAQNGHVQGFSGLTFGDVTSSSTFGGNFSVPLSDNLHVVGEGGRMTDVMPSLISTIVDFTPIDVRIAAWYGEAGIRLIGSSRRAVRPYGEATAGFARLTTGVSGAGRPGAIVNSALGLFNRTEPLLGLGAGVVLQGGPLVVDLGYRYKKIRSSDSLQALLTGGDVNVSQVRVGVGFRF